MITPRPLLLLALLAGPLAGAGCGGEQVDASVPTTGDARLVVDLVEEFNERHQDPRTAEPLFVKGAFPSKEALKRYAPYSYWANVGGPAISGDTATMKVKVRDEKTGEDRAEVGWTFAREGSDWKLKAAPLP